MDKIRDNKYIFVQKTSTSLPEGKEARIDQRLRMRSHGTSAAMFR
jgi:hypothetical protein